MKDPISKCPFCGAGAAALRQEPDPEDCTGFFGMPSFQVHCFECGAAGPEVDYTGSYKSENECKRSAIFAWNLGTKDGT